MAALINRLRKAGFEVDQRLNAAMMEVDIRQFTDIEPTPFFHDRPIVFLETLKGGVKTISAPHMVSQLLLHLELATGNTVLIIGCKGGYMGALVSELVGPEGEVFILDPSEEVVIHATDRLFDRENISVKKIEDLSIVPPKIPASLSRVLVTGSLREIPNWIENRLEEGGFILAPLGGRTHQKLVKRERQGDALLDTDLGSVVFGPVDICESEPRIPSPQDLADLFDEGIVILRDHFGLSEELINRMYDLIAALRQLPDDLQPPIIHFDLHDIVVQKDIADGGDDLDELEEENAIHPLLELLEREAEWLAGIWPLLLMITDIHMMHPGAPEHEGADGEGNPFGGADDSFFGTGSEKANIKDDDEDSDFSSEGFQHQDFTP